MTTKNMQWKRNFDHNTNMTRFIVTLSYLQSKCFVELINTVLDSEDVFKIYITSPLHLLNNYVRGIIQSGYHGVEQFSFADLTGEGVVVGLSDSGIDERSCFFHDENCLVPRSTFENPVAYLNQRKNVEDNMLVFLKAKVIGNQVMELP